MNNKVLQILRGKESYNPLESEEMLLDGQLFYSKFNKQLYIGDHYNYTTQVDGPDGSSDSIPNTLNGTLPIGAANLIPTNSSSLKLLSALSASGTNSVALGLNTRAAGDNLIVVGKHNAEKNTALFIIGNGADSSNPSNALEVLDNNLNTIIPATFLNNVNIVTGDTAFSATKNLLDIQVGSEDFSKVHLATDMLKLTYSDSNTLLLDDSSFKILSNLDICGNIVVSGKEADDTTIIKVKDLPILIRYSNNGGMSESLLDLMSLNEGSVSFQSPVIMENNECKFEIKPNSDGLLLITKLLEGQDASTEIALNAVTCTGNTPYLFSTAAFSPQSLWVSRSIRVGSTVEHGESNFNTGRPSVALHPELASEFYYGLNVMNGSKKSVELKSSAPSNFAKGIDIDGGEILLRGDGYTSSFSNSVYVAKNVELSSGGIKIKTKGGTTSEAITCYLSSSGDVTANTFKATSDRRLKENIIPYKCEKSILDLPIYEFDYINGGNHTIGCMAQDLREVCPEIVSEGNDGFLHIEESKLIYLLLLEVKNLKEEVKTLRG